MDSPILSAWESVMADDDLDFSSLSPIFWAIKSQLWCSSRRFLSFWTTFLLSLFCKEFLSPYAFWSWFTLSKTLFSFLFLFLWLFLSNWCRFSLILWINELSMMIFPWRLGVLFARGPLLSLLCGLLFKNPSFMSSSFSHGMSPKLYLFLFKLAWICRPHVACDLAKYKSITSQNSPSWKPLDFGTFMPYMLLVLLHDTLLLLFSVLSNLSASGMLPLLALWRSRMW